MAGTTNPPSSSNVSPAFASSAPTSAGAESEPVTSSRFHSISALHQDFTPQSVSMHDKLRKTYPWTASPIIVSAPMRVMTGPGLALAVARAGGLGFIGPGESPQSTAKDLETVKSLLSAQPLTVPGTVAACPDEKGGSPMLPVGVGYQMWNGSLPTAAQDVATYKPCAAWLFAPEHGQSQICEWTKALREASPSTQIWLQVGTLWEALGAAKSDAPPDVLVIQGAEAGGHGRTNDGIGFISLLPEVADATRGTGIPLFAAGGIVDARGVAAALGLGAAGVAMGTRFLAAKEARIKKGYQDEVLRAKDGATSTTRTQLYNHLRGTFGWPEAFSPRGIINKSYVEMQAGVPFEELKRRHDDAVQKGGPDGTEGTGAWGPEGRTATYAGASVGLVKTVDDAGTIVRSVREEAISIIRNLGELSRL